MTGLLIGEATRLKLRDTYENGTHLILVMNPVDYTEEWKYMGKTGRGVGTSVIMSSDPGEEPKRFLEKAMELISGDIAFVYTVGQKCKVAHGISNYSNVNFTKDDSCGNDGCPGKARCKL
jgi:hypothetical protein